MKVYTIEYVYYDPFAFSRIIGVELTVEQAFKTAEKIISVEYSTETVTKNDIAIWKKDEDDFAYFDKQKTHVRITEHETSEATK